VNIEWNVDNFFMASMYLIVIAISIISYNIGIKSANGWSHDGLRILFCLHVVPLLMLIILFWIEKKCRGLLE
jgi:hypothetical protein